MTGAWNRSRLGDVCRVIPGYAFNLNPAIKNQIYTQNIDYYN